MELFDNLEQTAKLDRAVLVQLKLASTNDFRDAEEFRELVSSAGAEVVQIIGGSRYSPHPKYFVGSGKAEEIQQSVEIQHADVVIFDHKLSPAQERNIERLVKCRVLDRTTLILDIFAQRARSHEGKLQVELAQLKHMSTRLVRGWSHLERQKGGIGMRGPGETQLETDRRLLSIRIKQINKRLTKVSQQREQGRQSRKKALIPTVSLVGYTNAGKSSLFNAITGSDVLAEDQLFATLDPTLRRLSLPNQQNVILADTVGFIRDLPHDLIAAFKATLQETIDADLLLHVVDAADENRHEYIEAVDEVIHELGVEDTPQLLVMNKIDLVENKQSAMEYDDEEKPVRVWLSAAKADGLDNLYSAIASFFEVNIFTGAIKLPIQYAKVRAVFYEKNAILSEEIDKEGNYILQLSMQHYLLENVLSSVKLELDTLVI